MLRNVLIVKLAKLYTVNFYVFLSALYMLQYVPIVIILVIVYLFKKKKKKKNDLYSGMGKNTKVMPQYPTIYLSLGKGRESLRLKILHKRLITSALLTCPQHKRFRQSVDDARQNCPKYVYFSANFTPFQ